MIVGLGCDIVDVSRFAKGESFLLRFIRKHFTNNEIKELEQRKNIKDIEVLTLSVATRFAAKEAIAKALGTGFRDGLSLKSIEIMHDNLGKPKVILYDKALVQATNMAKHQNFNIHITISNEQKYANSVAIIECF